MDKLTIMDSPFHKARFKKSLRESISNLAATSLWSELDEGDKIEFIESWKILSRPALYEKEDINHSLDMDQLMEEAANEWVKSINET